MRLAAIRSQFEIVKYLVEERKVKPGKDARVMHMVIMAEKNAKEMFKYLASQGGNVNAYMTPLPIRTPSFIDWLLFVTRLPIS